MGGRIPTKNATLAPLGLEVLLQGTDVEFQFATKLDRDFPTDLIAPLFFAVSMTTDPARDLVSSDPSLGLVEFGNPGTRLVWVISVDGLGEVSVRRGSATTPVDIDPRSLGTRVLVGPR
jgi:hypothetical protein